MDKDFDFVTIDCHHTTISDSKQFMNKRKRRECSNDLLSPKIGVHVQDASPGIANEDNNIRDFISTLALDWWQSHFLQGLSCPLCRGLMKDAVLAKCCFKSFCDKCIKDSIKSNSLCICGATNVLADDFLPNRKLRDTIAWFLKSSKCHGANSGSPFQPQGTESAQFLQVKVPSSTLSTVSKGVILASKSEGNAKVEEMPELVEVDNLTPKTLGEATVGNGAEISEATRSCAREPGSQMCFQLTDEEMQQKLVFGELGKKKRKCVDMHSRSRQKIDYGLRDDDRQFKKRPSRFESAPTVALKEGRHSRRG